LKLETWCSGNVAAGKFPNASAGGKSLWIMLLTLLMSLTALTNPWLSIIILNHHFVA
jgi:hypothetical protein